MSFVAKNKHIGYGELQYGYTDAKTMYDAPAKLTLGEKLAKGYYLLIAACMLVWYVYSLITHSINDGFINAFLSGGHLLYLVALIVIELVVILSAFNLWGAFMRLVLRRNLVNRAESDISDIESELERADANKYKENALYVYTSFIVITNFGRETVFNRSVLRSVSAIKRGECDLDLEFFLKDEDRSYNITVPYFDLIKLRKIFSGILTEKSERQNVGINNESIGAICFGVLFIFIGIFLIVSRFTFMQELGNVPLLFGIVFSAFGILAILLQFYKYVIFKEGFVPLFTGFIFFVLPFSILYLVGQELGVTINTFFGTFNYNAVAVFLLSFSPVFISGGIVGIVKCIRYRKK